MVSDSFWEGASELVWKHRKAALEWVYTPERRSECKVWRLQTSFWAWQRSRSHTGHQCRNQTSLSHTACMLHAVWTWFRSRWTHNMRALTWEAQRPFSSNNKHLYPDMLTGSAYSFKRICWGGEESLKLKYLLVNVKAHESIQCKVRLGRLSILESSENKRGYGMESQGPLQRDAWACGPITERVSPTRQPGDLVSLNPEGRLTDTEGGYNTDFECDFFLGGGWLLCKEKRFELSMSELPKHLGETIFPGLDYIPMLIPLMSSNQMLNF